MKIAIIDWKSFGINDIKSALALLGHTYVSFSHPDYDLRHSESFTAALDAFIKKEQPDIVFSSNYFPLVSKVCDANGLIYYSWVYDCPHLSLYSATVINKCNRIFLFDGATYSQLVGNGIDTVFYMPLAANTTRLDSIVPDTALAPKLDCDISFVGSMYNESPNLFERLSGLDDFSKGYLDGIMDAQLKISGCNFIEELLKGHVLDDLRKVMPYTPDADGVESDTYIYSRYFIDRRITELERFMILDELSKEFKVNLFTHNETNSLPHVHRYPAIDSEKDAPAVFKSSRINLNITLRSIESGIPLRAFEIMGCGGFLMTNFQSDFLNYFEPGKDFVYYEDLKDLKDKCHYYLSHEDERLEIAHNGHEKIKACHTYVTRLKEMFSIT